jgi:hypothetical protein
MTIIETHLSYNAAQNSLSPSRSLEDLEDKVMSWYQNYCQTDRTTVDGIVPSREKTKKGQPPELNERLTVDRLDEETLIKMPFQQFLRYAAIQMHSSKCLNPLMAKSRKLDLDQLIEKRRLYHAKNPNLMITKCGKCDSKGIEFPSYQWFESLDYLSPHDECLYFTYDVLTDLAIMPRKPLDSVEELDNLVKALSEIDLIAWDLKEGVCYARANLTLQLLTFMGIPEKSLFKEYAVIPILMHNKFDWGYYYHVAPLIVLSDKTEWIIDPALHRSSAMTVNQWYELLGNRMQLLNNPQKRLENAINPGDFDAFLQYIGDQYATIDAIEKRYPNDTDALFKEKRNYQLLLSSDDKSFKIYQIPHLDLKTTPKTLNDSCVRQEQAYVNSLASSWPLAQ